MIRLVEVAVHQIQPRFEGSGSGTLVVDSLQGIPVNLLQRLANRRFRPEHSDGMRLHHTNTTVIVDDQPRKSVSLTVHQPIAIGLRRAGSQSGRFPDAQGPAEHLCPEIRFQHIFAGETENPHGYRTDLVVPMGQKGTIAGIDANHISLSRFPDNLRDRAGKHPGMETQDRIIPAFFQIDLRHDLSAFFDGGGAICSAVKGCFSDLRSRRYISRQIQASVAA